MYKLIMLNNPILVSGEEINEYTKPCYCFNSIKNTWDDDVVFYQGAMPKYHYKGFQKIIAGISELPSIDLSALSEEDCKKIGWVDVDDEIYCKAAVSHNHGDTKEGMIFESGYFKGFKAAQSLNEKKFSEEDIRKAFEAGMEFIGEDKGSYEKLIQSLSQPKVFDVEVEMKTKCYCGHTDWCDCSENQGSPFIQQPKITNNSIKVVKVL